MSEIKFEWCEYGHKHIATRKRKLFIKSFINMYEIDKFHNKLVEADDLLKIIKKNSLEKIIIDKDLNKTLEVPILKYIINGKSHEMAISRSNIFIWMYLNSICLNIHQALKHNDHELVGIIWPRNSPHNC